MQIARLLFLLCLILFLCTSGRAQCPTSNVFITTNAQAMAYETSFGNCTDLTVNLSLNGPVDYTKAFQNIVSINGDLSFINTTFTEMDDFAGLKKVTGDFIIKGTALKTAMANVGLALQDVGTLQIANNNDIESFDAMQAIQTANGLYIRVNPQLTDINVLNNLELNGPLAITNNTSLNNCDVVPVCAKIAAEMDAPADIDIVGNASNCANRFAVQADCLNGAACPPDAYVFSNQDVLDFDAAFPNCENLTGNLEVVSPITNAFRLNGIKTAGGNVRIFGISDIDFLGLTSIGGDLTVESIQNGPELTNGVLPLETIGGRMTIAFCSQITNLASFGNLNSVDDLVVSTCLNLESFSGLQSLELNNALFLFNLDQLESLNSMSGINISGKTFEQISLEGNFRLEDISYLDDLAHVSNDLRIKNNSNLSECSYTPICSTIGEGTAIIQISNNDSDCNTIPEVRDICFPDYGPLVALYNATDGANWTDKTGWDRAIALQEGVDPCGGWYGVSCENGRVTGLNLNDGISGNGLSGSIPLAFWRLPKLKLLDLSFNNLSGNLSGDIGLLTDLEDLSLSVNSFSGRIPGGIGLLSKLKSLRLNSNDFNNTIPSSLFSLPLLELVWLHGNELTGGVPVAVESLQNLQSLYLNGNQLTGALPKITSPQIRTYFLGFNSFSGTIPEDLFPANHSLFDVRLNSNQLNGPLPEILSTATNILLRDNQLSGCYPASYSAFCGTFSASSFISNPGLPDAGSATFFTDEFCGNSDACGSLPVSWLAFTAAPNGKVVDLNWATAAEENNAGFTVERSTGTGDWRAISQLIAGGRANDYDYTDPQPLAGTSYYRIRQTDFDGAFSFSEVRQVSFSDAERAAYPNPFSGQLTIYATATEQIEVIDQQGRVVKAFTHLGGGAQVQSLELKQGVYTLRYRSSGRVERVVAR